MKTKTTLAAVAALLIGMLALPAAAHGTEVTPDREVAYALEHEAGGYATGQHTAYWPKTGMQFTSSQAMQTMSVGSCATGSVCAYSGASLTGSKLSWSTCSTFSTSALGSVGSIDGAQRISPELLIEVPQVAGLG